MSEPNTPIRAVSSAVYRPLESGGVLLDVDTGAYFEVNDSGRFIWELIASGTDRAALIAAVAKQFDLDPDVATEDVDDFLAELGRRSLLTSPDSPASS